MSAELLTHPDVTGAIVRIVRRAGFARQDWDDAVGNVQLRVLKSLRNKPQIFWPQTVDAWKALAIRATKSMLYDRWKKMKAAERVGDAGAVVEEPDAHAAQGRRLSERDPIDQKRGVALLAELLTEKHKGELDAKILDMLLDDIDQAEIAVQLGLKHQQVRDRVRSMRTAFAAKVTSVLGGVGALAVLLLLRGPHEPRYYSPAPDVAFTEASPEKVAADEREQARPLCRAGEWQRCVDLLDAAAKLDPAGDRAPEIQEARNAATQAFFDDLREREVKFGPAPNAPPKAPTPPQKKNK